MKIWKRFGKLFHNTGVQKAQSIQQVAIFGFADSKEEEATFKSAVEVAKRLAQAGYLVVDGGGPGIMRAATIGAKQGGGKVIGVTFYPEDMTNFEGRDPRNPIDEEIKTSSYVERTLTLMKEGQVYVVFNGGTGTLSEFAMAWGLARLYFGHHKPLILYGKFWNKIINAIKDNMQLRPDDLKVFKIVDSPQEVLEAIELFEKEIQAGVHDGHLAATKNGYSV
ncbi:LOG family protein [Candidatus Daviesbacteria bacterium]|nr:LOG family protein [Candidatus Daviesbacteria bacterium]